MADRPMLFSAPMVRALIDGRKTQTRRTLPIPREIQDKILDFHHIGTDTEGRTVFEMRDHDHNHVFIPAGLHLQTPQFITRIGAGDRLWVRESITRFDKGTCDQHVWYRAGRNSAGEGFNIYARTCGLADDEQWPASKEGPAGGAPYNAPSIHMPRWASRLTLVVTDVRIERLNAITEADAIAEGIEPVLDYRSPGQTHWKDYETCDDGTPHPHAVVPFVSPVDSYRSLWDEINGRGAWATNPWVVAYSFAVHLAHIDEVPA